ncbi:MAG: hypothetical protein ACI8VT_002001, partial [Saprospiraceae bacterium]
CALEDGIYKCLTLYNKSRMMGDLSQPVPQGGIRFCERLRVKSTLPT